MNRSRMFRAAFQAEFLKILAFRFPLHATFGLVLFVILVTLNLVGAERLSSHVHATSAVTFLPYLAWASWGKLLIIPVFLIAFATYCTVVDSQYGMVRIGCSQPMTRFEYAAAKTAAILAHSALFMLLYAVLLVASSSITGRVWAMTWHEAMQTSVFCFRIVTLGVGIAWLVTAAALMRRTLLTGFVTAVLVIIGFAWLNTLPTELGLRPYLLFRYFLYPLAPVWPKEWTAAEIPNAGARAWQFLTASLVTPAICWAAAVTYFTRRDITE